MQTPTNRVRLRSPQLNGRQREWLLHEEALRQEIVERDRLGPDTETYLDGHWITLHEHPNPTWLEPLARLALEAARSFDAQRLEYCTGKILRFCDREENEIVRLAYFLQGHLRLCEGKDREAANLLQTATRFHSDFYADANNNLGVAWARLRHPEAALAVFEETFHQDADLVVAHLSLRNMAQTLIGEGAANLLGRPTWREIAARETSALQQFPAATIKAQLAPGRRIPGSALWHVFRNAVYIPGIGSQLPRNPHGQAAAKRLLHAAQQALSDGDHIRSMMLARASTTFDNTIKAEADHLAAAAAAKVEIERMSNKAERLVQRLERYLRDLRSLTLDDLDAAQESRILLEPLLRDEHLSALHHQRVEEIILEVLDEADTTDRGRLLDLACQYASPPEAEAYYRAARACLARRATAMFWEAIGRQDLAKASKSLEIAFQIMGPETRFLQEAQTLLQRLEKQPTNPVEDNLNKATGS